MKLITLQLKSKERDLLWEALRRILWLSSSGKVKSNLAGLGFPSTYKEVVKRGLFTTSFSRSIPRVCSWYKLTPLGQQIAKQMIRKKIVPKNCHDMFSRIPYKI